MKLNYSQLEMQLSKKLFPVYILSGEEILLKQDSVNWIRKAAKKAGYQRVGLAEIKENELYQLLYATSFLTEKRLLELNLQSTNKAINQILDDYAKKPIDENLLLIEIGKLENKIIKQMWYQQFEKIGCVVSLWPITRDQLPQWIATRAKKYKLDFTLDAAKILAEYVEGNLIAASQAIEKIYLLKPQQLIDETLINTVLNDESSFTIFDLSECLIGGNTARCLHILEKLRLEGIEPTLILWSITRELRLLVQLATEIKQGVSYDGLFQKYKIFSRRQPGIRRFLNQYHIDDCYQLLMHAAQVDQMIKGILNWNVWEALQLFCLRFSEK